MSTTRFAGTTPRETIADLQSLSREYASFSRSRGGLGNVLGGIVALLVFGGVWLLGAGLPATLLTIGLTAAWLVGKEAIRRGLYRRYGQAREVWCGVPRRIHTYSVLLFTPPLLAFAAWIVVAGWLSRPGVGLPYLIFCMATPAIIWCLLYTPNEMMSGFGLLFMCAITASGHMPDQLGLLFVPANGLVMISMGLEEHRRFRALAARLDARDWAAE